MEILARKKQLREFVARLFTKRKSRASLFADAIDEGIRDMVREMGYKPDHNSKKSKKPNDNHGLLQANEQTSTK